MTPRKSLTLVLTFCVLGLIGCGGTPGAQRAAVDIPALKMVPDNALAVVLVNNVGQVDGKFTKLGQTIQAPIPPMLATVKGMLNVKEGVDEKGTLIFAVVAGEHEPAPLIFVPVTDYEKFVAQLSPEKAGDFQKVQTGPAKSLVAKKGNYAVLTEGGNNDVLKAALNAKGDISAELSPVSGWIAEQDVAFVGTTAGIKFALKPMRSGLENAKKFVPVGNPEQAAQITAMFDMYDNLFKQCDEQLSQAAIGLKVDKDSNVHVTSHWGFKAGGAWATSVANIKTPAQKPLSDLPAGPFVFAGSGVLPENMAQWSVSMMKWSPQFANLNDEQRRKMETVFTDFMKGMESMSFAMGVPAANESLFKNSTFAMRVDNAPKFMEMLEPKMKQLKEVYQAAKIPGADSYEVKSLDINGAKAMQFTMDVGAMIPPDTNESAKKLVDAIAGSDGKMTVTYVAADDKTILAIYTGGEEAAKRLAEYKNRSGSLATDAETAKTLALLPRDAQWVGVWDLPGTLAIVQQVASKVAPDAVHDLPILPSMPPVGIAVQASSQGLDTDLALPVDTLKALATTAQSVMAHRMQAATQPPSP